MSKTPKERVWFGVALLSLTTAFIGAAAGSYFGYETLSSSPTWIKATLIPAIVWMLATVAYVSIREIRKGVQEWRTA